MDYNQIISDAFQNVLQEYRLGKIHILAESDLKSHLFCKCMRLIEQNGLSFPFQVHAEKDVFEKRRKIDLVLGDNEVLVEVKFEPKTEVGGQGRVFSTIREAGGLGCSSIEEDLQKIENYAKKGRHGHFLMIDETGWHANTIVQGEWRSVKTKSRRIYTLHIHTKPTN